MGKLCEKMRQDMAIRGLSARTQETYLQRMRSFVRFHGKSPELLGLNEIYQYQVYLAQQKKASWCIFNQSVCAIRFFYTKTLHREWDIQHIPYQKQGRKLPTVLSKEEVRAVLRVTGNLKKAPQMSASVSLLGRSGVRLHEQETPDVFSL